MEQWWLAGLISRISLGSIPSPATSAGALRRPFLEEAMTVEQLIEELKKAPPKAPVQFDGADPYDEWSVKGVQGVRLISTSVGAVVRLV